MYNSVFPKEALELYSIIKLDNNNFIMQDVFSAAAPYNRNECACSAVGDRAAAEY